MEKDSEDDGTEAYAGQGVVVGNEGGGFKSFTAHDWERIESVPPNTRAVGQMMRQEAQKLVEPACREDKRFWSGFDVAHYHQLCERFHVLTQGADNDVGKPAASSKAAGKAKFKRGGGGPASASVREKAAGRLSEQDARKIEGLCGSLPRWESAGNRWEAYLVGFRIWASRGGSPRLDRLISTRNLKDLLLREFDVVAAPLRDLDNDIQALLEGQTFRSILEEVAASEQSLVSPSFAHGWAGLRLYPEQAEVARMVLDCLRGRLRHFCSVRSGETHGIAPAPALMLRFCTPPSTGKSSAAAYLGALMMFFGSTDLEAAKRHAYVPQSYVIYECYSESVRFDVAKTCVAAGVPFAIVTNGLACPSFCCYHGKAKKIRGVVPPQGPERIAYSMKVLDACDVRPVVLVCDPISAMGLLEARGARSLLAKETVGDVLLFDEPTAGINLAITQLHAEIMRRIPAITIMMSATLPEFEALPVAIENARQAFGEALTLQSVKSQRIVSPCTIVDARARVYAPHRLFKGTCRRLASVLRTHLHLLRLYSPRAVLQLFDDLRVQLPEVVTDLELALRPTDACDFETIRHAALELLELVEDSTVVLPLACIEGTPYVPPDMKAVCTTEAHLLAGTSIILSEDEDAVWQESMPQLLQHTQKLSKRLVAREQALAKVEKIRVHASGSRRESGGDGSGGGGSKCSKERDTQTQRQRQEESMRADVSVPEVWPAACCINSLEHRNRYASREASHDPASAKFVPAVPQDILEGSCESLVEGMLSGLCTLHSKFSDQAFDLVALDLAEGRAFTFVSGGRSAIYGVNLPCDRVILALAAESTSPETLVQCMGRCGRTGKYTRSEVMFGTAGLLAKVFDEEELLSLGTMEKKLDDALGAVLATA